MESIKELSIKKFPDPNQSTCQREDSFFTWLKILLPSNKDKVKYTFDEVRGDGNCLFYTIFRYLGYLNIDNLPNKDYDFMDQDEKINYNEYLDNLILMVTEYCKEFLGDDKFKLDTNTPEYQLICGFISTNMDLRIIVLEYDAYSYKNECMNKVSKFTPDSGLESDTIILLNFSHHFTLIFPHSTDPSIDTKGIRKIVGDELIQNAIDSNKLL